MSVRARKKIRLNFSAFRKLPPASTSQNGVARRTFLVGAAAAAVSTTGVGKAIASSTLRIRKRYDKSGELRSVSIGANGMRAWTLDLTIYDGDPRLSLEESSGELAIRLEGARLPGTHFDVNFTARLKQRLLSRTIEFDFVRTGVEPCDFSMSAAFDDWLAGESHAAANLTALDTERLLGKGLHDHIVAVPEGSGTIFYLPNGGFDVRPKTLRLNAAERTLSVAGLVLAPSKVNREGEVESPESRMTLLEAHRAGTWRGKVVFETPEGWTAKGTLKGFEKVSAELHSPEAAFVALECTGRSDLRASNSNGIEFKLERAKLAYLMSAGETTRALSAKLDQAGSWLTFNGFSLEVGPHGEDAEALFAEFEDADGKESRADIQGGIRNAAFQLDGAVTKARMTDVEPISLAGWEDGQGGNVRPGTTLQPPQGGVRQGVASRLDIQAVPKFRLAPFQIEVVRREDMLALTFEFINFSLSGGATPSLVRSDATKPAYVAVIFPPQALAEAHYQEGPTGAPTLSALSGLSRRPIPSRLSGETRLVFWVPTTIASIPFSLKGDNGQGRNGLLDWAKWKPSITATAVSAYGSPRIRVDSGFLNPIDSVTIKPRLGTALRITPPPEDEADPGFFDSLRKLAAKKGPAVQGGVRPGQLRPNILQPNTGTAQGPKLSAASQLGRLAAGIDPTVIFKFIPKARIEPNALHTQIEMPVRIILSTTEEAGWSHPAVLDDTPPGNRHALWHSRLGNLVPGVPEPAVHLFSDDGKSFYKRTSAGSEGPFNVGSRSGPTVRVIDAVDYGVSNLMPVIRQQTQGQVVQEYPMTQDRRKELVDSMCWRGEGPSADTNPFLVENLMLTPLGGYLKGEWNWRQPSGWPNPTKPELIAWRHVSTLGRDQYMKLVIRGYVFPTGHKATLTIISERKFNTTAEGKIVAYVRSRRFVTIRDPLVTVSGAEQQALGFQSITMLTHETPILDPFAGPYSQWGNGVQLMDKVVLLYSGGQPVMFQMKGVDMENRTIPWAQPMLFVAISVNSTDGARVEKLISEYEKGEQGGFPGGFPRRGKLYGQTVAFAKGGGQAPTGEDSEGNTSFPVNNMLISGKTFVGAATPFNQDLARWKPVLFKASISAPAVQMMQGKPPLPSAFHMPGEMFDMEQLQASTEAEMMFADDDFFDVKIPDVFKQNGFGSGNKSQMFLELIDKYAPKFGDTSKSGGIANPEMLIQGLSKGKGPIGGDLNEILNGNVDPKKLLDTGARLLGAVKIFDLLPNPIKIDPGGTDAPYIELLLIYDDGKNKPPTGATTAVKWKPPLKNWGFPNSPPLFYVNSFKSPQPKFGGATGELLLEGSITTKFKGGGKPTMIFRGSMKNFRVDLISPASFLWLDFKIIEFIAEVGKPFDVNVDLTKMTFTGPLTFVQKLQDLINGEGGDGLKVELDSDGEPKSSSLLNTADVGLDVYLDVDETGIRAGLTLGIPSVGVGVFAIRNISIGVKLILPFFGDPLSARFNFCERNNTFQISVMGVTGGGFVALEVNIDGNMIFEAALEFGGSLSIDLGVASGGVSIMGGVYFRLENKECMLEAYIRLQGNLSVLGLIRISLEFYLSLTYYSDGNRLVGTATITVEIEILFFSISVGVTVQRQLAGESSGGSYFFAGPNALPAADQTTKFTEAVSQVQWTQFCEAFA